MDDLVFRQEAMDAIRGCVNVYFNNLPTLIYREEADAALRLLPTAQKKGHWIDEETNYICSECHRGCWVNSDYCPWCGADMRGEQDE